MKYIRPELYICMMCSTDVITMSGLEGKVETYSAEGEDNLDWALNN